MTTTAPTRGRPQLPKGIGKESVVTLRLSPSDRAFVDSSAKIAGLSLSDWARSILLREASPKEEMSIWYSSGIKLEIRGPLTMEMWRRLREYVHQVLDPDIGKAAS